MSIYMLPNNGLSPGYYQQLTAATPLWQEAPVPGWGINPLRAGPRRVGVGAYAQPLYSDNVPLNSAILPHYVPIGADAAAEQTTYGVVAAGVAGGIVLGLAFGWLWFANKPMKSNRRGSKKKEAETAYRDYVKEELSRGQEAELVGFEEFLAGGAHGQPWGRETEMDYWIGPDRDD